MKVKIKNVKVVSGGSLNKYWESDMQVVTTDKGKGIDNAVESDYKMGHDWKNEIGNYVNVKMNIDKYGNKWINYKSKAKTTEYLDEEQDRLFDPNVSKLSKDNDINWATYFIVISLLGGMLLTIFK